MTSNAPTPGRPARPCTAELLARPSFPSPPQACSQPPSCLRTQVTDTPINVASPDCAEDFFAGAARCVILWRAASLAELREVLERCLDLPARPSTLDLIGHSTRGHRLLRLGQIPIDMLDPQVSAFFRELAKARLRPACRSLPSACSAAKPPSPRPASAPCACSRRPCGCPCSAPASRC